MTSGTTRSPIYRVTGLPILQPDDELKIALAALIDSNLSAEEKTTLNVKIDIVPFCYGHDEQRGALIEFRGGLPAFLSALTANPLDGWQIEMGDVDVNFDLHFHGFTQLYIPKANAPVTADVIAITGLDGHAYGSWRGKGNLGRMWLRDFLRKDLPHCRTMIYGYNSKLSSRGTNTIMDYGRELLEQVGKARNTQELWQRPLFFIAHSFGGIILVHSLVKAAHSNEKDHPAIAALYKATYGMLLFATPHKGLVVDDIRKMLIGQSEHPRNELLDQISQESNLLYHQLDTFKNLIGDRKISSFYERGQTRQLEYDSENQRWQRTGEYVTAVTDDSALLQLPDSVEEKIPLNADHSMIVKFDATTDAGYSSALGKLRQYEKNAPSVVASRFLPAESRPKASGLVTEPSGNVHWIVPRKVNSLFTGRSKLVDRIQSALSLDQPSQTKEQRRFVITGLGGQGKSEVCLKVANLMREEFWGVFWVDVGTPSTAKNGFLAIAKVLGLPAGSIDDSRQALASMNRRWLLVLDNADNPEFDYVDYIPSGDRGAVIITSRVPDCNQYSSYAWEALESLDLQHSTQLLLRAAQKPEASWPSHERDAQDVVQLLASHTLALIQAGAYIAGGYCRLDQYRAKYQQQRERMLEYYPKQERSRYSHVYATFEASIAVLHTAKEETRKDALSLLAVLSMLHSSMLPLDVFIDAWAGARKVLRNEDVETCEIDSLRRWHVEQLPECVRVQEDEWDNYRLKTACNLLASLSLVTSSLNSHNIAGLSMHPLAHAWAQDRLGKEEQKEAWVRAGCLLSLLRWGSYRWQVYEKELRPHVQTYLSPSIKDMLSYAPQGLVLPIVLQCGWMLNVMREDARLARLLKNVYVELQITPSQPSTAYLPIWELAASNMRYIGDDRHALALLEHVVKVRETTLVETHPSRLDSQHELARAYYAVGRSTDAVELLEHVVEIQETTLVETHPSRLGSQHELARVYCTAGRTTEAIELLEHVVKVKETTLVETHPDYLVSQHELARAYYTAGRTTEAIELLEHVVKVKETTLVETHPARLASQHGLALAYHAAGQTTEAIKLLARVVAIKTKVLSADHPSRIVSTEALQYMRAQGS